MIISMISIGTELLDGRVQDSNSQVVGRFLNDFGRRLNRVVVVPDEVRSIVQTLNACDRGIIVVSGGLGPTDDDLTRFAIAQWCGKNLVEDADSVNVIKEKFATFKSTFTENNRRQALFPKGATILENTKGTAPAFLVEHDGKQVYVFPGVPREFSWCFDLYVKGVISAGLEKGHVRAMLFQGVGESRLATELSGLGAFDVNVGYRAFYPNLELKLNASDEAEFSKAIDYIFEKAAKWYVCESTETPAGKVGALLLEKGATVTTVESCTAGGIAAAITEVAGSSAWFETGYVTYSNAAKSTLVGVESSVLDAHGAVSGQVVCQMALGAKKAAGADFAISVSGIAGPGGGSEEKPVGTVWFGLSTPTGTYAFLQTFRHTGRTKVRVASVSFALRFLMWALEDRLGEHEKGLLGPFAESEVFSKLGIATKEKN